jgi:hypothetical protein
MKSLPPSALAETACGVSSARFAGLAPPGSWASADEVLFLVLLRVSGLSAAASIDDEDAGGSGDGAAASSDAALTLVLRSMVERTEATDAAPDEDEARRAFKVPASVILGWWEANGGGAGLVEHWTLEGVHHAGVAAKLGGRRGACVARV